MASNHGHGSRPGAARGPGGLQGSPEWADGLRQLYDAVVEEDLPDTFKNLLDRLDAIPPGERDTAKGERNGSQ